MLFRGAKGDYLDAGPTFVYFDFAQRRFSLKAQNATDRHRRVKHNRPGHSTTPTRSDWSPAAPKDDHRFARVMPGTTVAMTTSSCSDGSARDVLREPTRHT